MFDFEKYPRLDKSHPMYPFMLSRLAEGLTESGEQSLIGERGEDNSREVVGLGVSIITDANGTITVDYHVQHSFLMYDNEGSFPDGELIKYTDEEFTKVGTAETIFSS